MLKKYRVLKRFPKPIMNSNRLVVLRPKSTVYLKSEKLVKQLVAQGILREIVENKLKTPKKQPKPVKKVEEKKPKSKQKIEQEKVTESEKSVEQVQES